MSRDSDRDRDADDLVDLLDDLRATLDELERTVDADRRRSDRRPADSRRRRPERSASPDLPRGRDVARFTEEYTIPTVIAVLETTIRSLELLRGVLRLADPDRRFRDDGDRGLAGSQTRVVDGAERALDDLRRALTGTEEPTDPVARDVYREARDLTAEIESVLEGARGDDRRSRAADRSRDADGETGGRGIVIPVDDPAEETGAEDASDAPDAPDDAENDAVTIDVDAELESIRDEVRTESGGGGSGDTSRHGDDEHDEEDGREGRGDMDDTDANSDSDDPSAERP